MFATFIVFQGPLMRISQGIFSNTIVHVLRETDSDVQTHLFGASLKSLGAHVVHPNVLNISAMNNSSFCWFCDVYHSFSGCLVDMLTSLHVQSGWLPFAKTPPFFQTKTGSIDVFDRGQAS